nr:hypothetical protein [Tanacetum cinerariifolium]
MDDPNITMKEYIRLEKEKARRRVKVYNWKTTKYDKIWCNEDVHDLISIETEFPAIVVNDALTSKVAPSCEPMPVISYFNDLDFFKDFENEFPAIVYNDALTSKLLFLTKPVVSPQHIDEFNLKDETSLSECDEKEQKFLYFNDLFPFNIIYPDDLKSDKDNDDDKIDIKQSSGDMSIIPSPNVKNSDVGAYEHGSNILLETSQDTSNTSYGVSNPSGYGVWMCLDVISLNPLVPMGIVESDSEVEVVFDETANLRISTSGKDGSDKGHGTNSLLEQWRDSYPDNDNYDPYDDDMYENHDLSEYLQSICDDLDITVRGRKKK